MEKDLNRIKKMYGEDFAKKICRVYFSNFLEREDFSFADYISSVCAPNKFLYEDLVKYNLVNKFVTAVTGSLNNSTLTSEIVEGTPEELMKKAGYSLYKCNTDADIEKFKKYYAKGEELCTFTDSDRLQMYTIFWAVKDNVKQIKRENFTNPQRQDDYGTSVISIQFTKGLESVVSIKNRYNHTVKFCDSTFSNNLENITEGLTNSFKKYYGINLVNGGQKFEIPGYILDSNGVYYKSNFEINNIAYCVDNVVINNHESRQYDKSRYVVADCYIIDRQNKTIELLPNSNITDSFVYQFMDNAGKSNIKKIDVENSDDNSIIKIYLADDNSAEITINKYNQIIKFNNKNLVDVEDGFMCYNNALVELNLPSAKHVFDNFLQDNECLTKLNTPNVVSFGDNALCSNKGLKSAFFPNLTRVGARFLTSNVNLSNFYAPKLEEVDVEFMFNNTCIENLYLYNLKNISKGFLKDNKKITRFYAPIKKSCLQYLSVELNKAKNSTSLFSLIKQITRKQAGEEVGV